MASQYTPARTAMITTTALVDAGRQIAAWLNRTLRDNDQADADVQYIQSIAAPETQLAVAVTQRENQHATSSTNTSNDLSTDLDTSGSNIQSTSAAIGKSSAVDSATAWKAYQVALASLDEGAATTAVDKAYQDALAHVTRNSRVAYANLTYTEGVAQVGSVADAITELGQASKTHVANLADDEKTYTDTAAPIIGARTLLYTEADNDLRKAITTADNVWRNNTAQAWGTHTAGDLVARGNVRRSLANTSNLIADASQASIAELKAQWWQNEIPNYLQWSVDIGGIETTYINSTTANILLRTTGVKNAGIAYASTVGTAIKAYETTTATARELYLSTLMTISETATEATMRADRDKEIALADADLQKQLTGNESAHTTAVNNANSAHSTATANAEATRKSAKQAALTQLNSTLAQATKDKEASIAGAERTYDQVVASLDAQYGSASSNGDTGVEGATRRSAIKTRDAQYYAARDTSWANTLSASTTLGTSPWTVKAISAANSQAAHSVSRANAQTAHDTAMLDAIEDWQLSSRESLTDLLFTEGQSRETYNVATSNVYANWEKGVGNLIMEEPSGTSYRGPASRRKEHTRNSDENAFQFVRFFGEENESENEPKAGNAGSQSCLPDSLPDPSHEVAVVVPPKFIIPPIRITKEQYEQFVSGLKNGEIALEEISLPVEGMHPKIIQFVGENRELYLAFTRQYGFAYQHKLNALFKMGFDVHVGGRHVMNWASGNIEMTNIYVDTSTFFVPSYHETTAERMKDIIDFIATKHEGVKSPVLRAGDFAVWYNPNQTMIQSGSLVDTNVYNLATQVAEDAATELILEVSGTKLAALSGGAAMQGGGAALHSGAEAGSVGLAAIMWWFRNRRAANRLVDVDISKVRIAQTLESNAEMKELAQLNKILDKEGFRYDLPFDDQIHLFRHDGIDYLVNGHHRKVLAELRGETNLKGIYLSVKELAEYGVTPSELVKLSEEAVRKGNRIRRHGF